MKGRNLSLGVNSFSHAGVRAWCLSRNFSMVQSDSKNVRDTWLEGNTPLCITVGLTQFMC